MGYPLKTQTSLDWKKGIILHHKQGTAMAIVQTFFGSKKPKYRIKNENGDLFLTSFLDLYLQNIGTPDQLLTGIGKSLIEVCSVQLANLDHPKKWMWHFESSGKLTGVTCQGSFINVKTTKLKAIAKSSAYSTITDISLLLLSSKKLGRGWIFSIFYVYTQSSLCWHCLDKWGRARMWRLYEIFIESTLQYHADMLHFAKLYISRTIRLRKVRYICRTVQNKPNAPRFQEL